MASAPLSHAVQSTPETDVVHSVTPRSARFQATRMDHAAVFLTRKSNDVRGESGGQWRDAKANRFASMHARTSAAAPRCDCTDDRSSLSRRCPLPSAVCVAAACAEGTVGQSAEGRGGCAACAASSHPVLLPSPQSTPSLMSTRPSRPPPLPPAASSAATAVSVAEPPTPPSTTAADNLLPPPLSSSASPPSRCCPVCDRESRLSAVLW